MEKLKLIKEYGNGSCETGVHQDVRGIAHKVNEIIEYLNAKEGAADEKQPRDVNEKMRLNELVFADCDKWMDDACGLGMLMGPWLEPFRPDIGYVIDIQAISFPKSVFPEEYEVIRAAYLSMLTKMRDHYVKKMNEKK